MATVFKGDQKAPFSLATALRCREGCYSFLVLFHFTLDPYFIMLSVNKGASRTIFWVFSMTRPGIEPWFPRPLVNTLPTRPIECLHKVFFWFETEFFTKILYWWILKKKWQMYYTYVHVYFYEQCAMQVVFILYKRFYLVCWLHGMSTLVGLFYAIVSSTIISNYIHYKMYLHNQFKQVNTL